MTGPGEGRRVALGLLVLRVSAGILMISGRGWDKLQHFAGQRIVSLDRLAAGSELQAALEIFSEFFCPIFVIFGIATRLTSIPPWVSVLVSGLILQDRVLLSEQQVALLYAMPYFVLMLTGAGYHSFDKQIMGHVRGGWFG